MPLLEIAVPNLLGGVSQQPAANRQPGQVEACDNALLHVVNGLAKRKGSRHLGKLFDGIESVLATHFINRDPIERYAVLLGERRIRVFDAQDGTEYPVKVNGTTTNAGRGRATSGAPVNYLDPRLPGGIVDQDEDFVIGVGDWLSVAANSVTSYITGRGPFQFGRRQSTTAVTADTVAEVGNGAVSAVSDIYQDYGVFAAFNAFSVYAKKSSSAINDVELSFENAGDVYSARFDIDSNGVFSVGSIDVDGSVDGTPPFNDNYVTAEVAAEDDGWYRLTVRFKDEFEDALLPILGSSRRIKIRFHTNAATPENKRLLLFGARVYSQVFDSQPLPDYVYPQPDLFRALTVADSTFLLNTEVVTAMDTPVTADQRTAAYVWVRTGNLPDINYRVTVHFTTTAVPTSTTFTFTTGAGPGGLQTDDDIAEGLRAAIDADPDLVAVRSGSVIRVLHVSATVGNAIRAVDVSDSRGDQSMVAVSQDEDGYSFITKFTDLPLIFDDNRVVLVTGNPERDVDDYWVRFNRDTGADLGAGHWEESIQPGVDDTRPGIQFRIDAGTLPHQLRRLQDDAAGTVTGTPFAVYFDVSEAAWDDRLVGDLLSNPDPSFIGETIRDLFLYRGRLGFLSVDNVILSEAGEVFNFWRTTVLDLIDPDPIDINSGTWDVVLFRNAASTADSLLLFSDRHQFQLLGDPTLTPNSAQLVAVRAFENLTQVRPVDAGRGVIFARTDGTFSSLMEAALLRDDVSFRFDDLTVQAPRYIVGKALQLAYSSISGLTLGRSAAPEILYVHQTFVDDQENRLQSAPHRWLFQADTMIRGIGFLDADLRLIVERAEGWFLESVLTDSETLESGRPISHLDRRVLTTGVYDGGLNQTTITLPYEIADPDIMRVVEVESGLIAPIIEQTATTLVVFGDLSELDLYAGENYDMEVTLTEPVIQDPSPRGGLIPRMGRPLDVRRLFLYLAETAYLECEVAADLRTPTVEEFSAAGLGTGLLLEGVMNRTTGDANFAVIGLSTELTVTLRNPTPFPSYIQSARWEIVHRQRASLS